MNDQLCYVADGEGHIGELAKLRQFETNELIDCLVEEPI